MTSNEKAHASPRTDLETRAPALRESKESEHCACESRDGQQDAASSGRFSGFMAISAWLATLVGAIVAIAALCLQCTGR